VTSCTLAGVSSAATITPALPTSTKRTTFYEYDAAYRLTRARTYTDGVFTPPTGTFPGVSNNRLGYDPNTYYAGGTLAQQYIYEYNARGSRISASMTDGATSLSTYYTYNAVQQLSLSIDTQGQLTHYVYNPAGSLLSAGPTTYTYDAAKRLTGVADPVNKLWAAYRYNGAGDRVGQTVNGIPTEYLLDPTAGLTQVLGEFGGGSEIYYLLGIGQQTNGDWRYFGTDGLGSTRMMFDATGLSTNMTHYDPYGGVLAR
jgi:YD repeat-containing protein